MSVLRSRLGDAIWDNPEPDTAGNSSWFLVIHGPSIRLGGARIGWNLADKDQGSCRHSSPFIVDGGSYCVSVGLLWQVWVKSLID